MTINNFSVGKDCTINVYDPMAGGVVSFAIITSFDAKQTVTKLRSKGMDGTNYFGTEYDGWEGTITIDRSTPAADNFFALRESLYHAGAQMENLTLTQTIQEADGSVTQWRYIGADVDFADAGTYKNGALIVQKVGWRASQREKIQ